MTLTFLRLLLSKWPSGGCKHFIENFALNKKNSYTGEVPLRHSFVPAPGCSETVRLRLLQSVVVSVGRRLRICESSANSKRYYSVLRESTRKMPEGKPFQRLPGNVKPKHYKLSLVPDLKSFTFLGDVSVQIEVGLFYHMPVLLLKLSRSSFLYRSCCSM